MRKRRVLLFSARQLLGESLEQTLCQVEGLELAGHWPVDDQAIDHLAGTTPDLVIITDECSSPGTLSHLTAEILDHYPDLPVFRVTLECNLMQVFSSQLLPARSKDLIEIIQNLPLKDRGAEAE